MKNFNKRLFSILVLVMLVQFTFAQLTIIIDEYPENTPDDAKIYISGDFADWKPNAFEFIKNDAGKFELTFTTDKKEIEFKFTRGNWETGECLTSGEFRPNRICKTTNNNTIHVSIEAWDDLTKVVSNNSTANQNVSILTDSFYMPQLQRYRRVWIYLPSDYSTSKKRYPVLYMHDGQNIFDKTTAYAGEWQVDETLLKLETKKNLKLIVVAIDNGQSLRMKEYNPWKHERFGGGEGDEYIDFIVKTLKPAIDKKYKTKSNRKNTGIMGSSMGGLISMYAILTYPDVFGKAGVFSPAFWAANKSPYELAQEKANKKMKIYMLMGKQEGDMMVEGQQQMAKILVQKKLKRKSMKSVIIDGKHNEAFWAKEFEKAVLWLYK